MAETPRFRPTIPDLVVLAVVSERATHGYELARELQNRDVKDWAAISRPQIYYSLAKAAREGWVEPVAPGRLSSGPERDTYKLTRAGARVLAEALARDDWATEREVPRFITWLALQHKGPAQRMRKVVAARRKFVARELERERLTLQALAHDPNVIGEAPHLMVQFGIDRFELELRWLELVDAKLFGAKAR